MYIWEREGIHNFATAFVAMAEYAKKYMDLLDAQQRAEEDSAGEVTPVTCSMSN